MTDDLMPKIEYFSGRIPDHESVLKLYSDAGWAAYTSEPDTLFSGINGSLEVYSAYSGDELIGFARVIGDGSTIVYILDILVLKAFQRRGIGKKLMESISSDYTHVRQKVLLTDDRPDTHEFYTSCGFVPADTIECRAYLKKKGE